MFFFNFIPRVHPQLTDRRKRQVYCHYGFNVCYDIILQKSRTGLLYYIIIMLIPTGLNSFKAQGARPSLWNLIEPWYVILKIPNWSSQLNERIQWIFPLKTSFPRAFDICLKYKLEGRMWHIGLMHSRLVQQRQQRFSSFTRRAADEHLSPDDGLYNTRDRVAHW